ncbi:MAG: T9SS type A sorting domain-containing protein [Bacteroidetes bacterium]|nr:T9SS type A sorting domain-containing protein [Bacteroidota bacterium]
MKKNIIFTILLLCFSIANAQKAVNFTCNDCSGKTHDLFKNLDSGKVVVIDWVMPCSSCIGPSKTTYNVVKSYDTIYPGKIVMFVADDYANTACPSIISWTDNNGMPNTIKFSNSAIKMTDYGTNGMPKVVIIAGKGHDVFFNENNSNISNITKLQNSLNAAIAATLNLKEIDDFIYKTEILPNPSNEKLTLNFNLKNPEKLNISVLNIVGSEIQKIEENKYFNSGENSLEICTENLNDGVYFLKIFNEKVNKTLKIIINN